MKVLLQPQPSPTVEEYTRADCDGCATFRGQMSRSDTGADEGHLVGLVLMSVELGPRMRDWDLGGGWNFACCLQPKVHQ